MSPATAPAPQSDSAPLSELSRITGVIFEPAKTFADIAKRPGWIVPLVLVILVSLAFLYAFSVQVGFDRAIAKAIEGNERMAQMPPEQRQRIIDSQMRFAPFAGYAGIVIFTPVYYLIASGIILGIVKGLMDAPIKFKQVFAVMAYASALPRITFSALAGLVMFMQNPDDFNVQNPFASNPAALMNPGSSSKFVHSLAGSLDVFNMWVIVLIAFGLKAAGGKSLSFAGALGAVVLPWAVWVLGRAALASVFNFG